jgi:hypothetical protein
MVLLAGVHPNVQTTKGGKVKDYKWDACKKQLLTNIPEYIDQLIKFKDVIDAGNVPLINWKEVREFLDDPYKEQGRCKFMQLGGKHCHVLRHCGHRRTETAGRGEFGAGRCQQTFGRSECSSSRLANIGPFTKPFRDVLMHKHWVPFLQTAADGDAIAMTADTNPLSILTNSAEIAHWNTNLLPSDRVSTENGAIVMNTVVQGRRPLLIDPQLQGIAWIRQMESSNNLIIVRMGTKGWIDKLKVAIGTDGAFLIENLDEKINAVGQSSEGSTR